MDSCASTAVNSSSVSLESTIAAEKGSISARATDKQGGEMKMEGDAKEPNSSDSDRALTGETGSKRESDADADDKPKKKNKPKPRVIKERVKGIYTIKDYESANFLLEWYKGLRASTPYLVRLIKTYWGLSKPFSIGMIAASLAKIILPTAELYVQKEFLDGVQRAVEGKPVQPLRMLMFLALRLLHSSLNQALEVMTYLSFKIDPLILQRSD